MKKLWWFNNRNARFPFNNRGEVDAGQQQGQGQQQGGQQQGQQGDQQQQQGQQGQQQGQGQQQSDVYTNLATKKGFKTQDDFANNYTELEADRSRKDTALSTAKQQLEAQGFTLDDKGNVVQKQGQQVQYPPQGQPQYPQGQQQPFQQPQYPQGQPQDQQQEVTYDPYTGKQITNPVDLQLAQMSLGQRTAVIVNAINQQNEKFQTDSETAANEVLTQPAAKGFEDDVKKVMRLLPLQQRTDKAEWEKALLQVKGAKFDQMRQNAGQQGVEDFINAQGNQGLPAGGGGGQQGGAKLSPEDEQTYQFYVKNRPELFKDRAHFARRNQSDGGGPTE